MRMDDHGPDFATFDAAEMGCGALILELRRALNRLPSGGLLELHARDPGARMDIPAWCRLAGHELIALTHPVYIIRKKGD